MLTGLQALDLDHTGVHALAPDRENPETQTAGRVEDQLADLWDVVPARVFELTSYADLP